jgi:hypothetical protein
MIHRCTIIVVNPFFPGHVGLLSCVLGACLSMAPISSVCRCFLSPSPITHHPRFYYPPFNSSHFPVMSHTHTTSTSSNFRLIFDNALKAYKKRTKNDLLTHPLADRFETCDSASSFLTVLQEQVQELNESQRSNTKWLDPTVNILHAFSETLGEGVNSVCFGNEHVRDLPSHLFDRYSHLQRWSLSDLVSSFQCVPFLIHSCGPP